MNYVLRHYQASALSTLLSMIVSGRRSVLIAAPTGAGKTVLACAAIERLLANGCRRILFCAHRSELIEQCSGKLDEIGIEHGIIKAGLDRGNRREAVQVASVQTYDRRAENLCHDYDVVIVDEAHHVAAATYLRIIERNSAMGLRPIIIGLTATPYRADGKGLGKPNGVFEDMIEVSTTSQLMAEGFLVPTLLFRGQQRPDFFGIREIGGDYDEGELAVRMNKPRLVGHVVGEYQRLAWGRRAVAFAVDVAHSKAITGAFQAAGIAAEHLDGETAAGDRTAILRRLARGQTSVVVNCGVLTEGFDLPALSAIIMARPTKSRGLWRQCLGRGLRPCLEVGKADCIILDHAGVTDQHGYLTDPDRVDLTAGLRKARERATMTCPACGAHLVGRPAQCPACGCPLGRGEDHRPQDLGDESRLEQDLAGAISRRPRPPAPAPYRPRPVQIARRKA